MPPVSAHPQVETFRVRLHEVELEVSQAGWGNGPLVILLHGFPESRHMWKPFVVDIAAHGYVVLAPDQRGYNRSGKPAGIAAYDLARVACDVTELAAAFGRRRYQVIGHDWGASVGWWIASTRPDEIERLLALSAPHPVAWRKAMIDDPDQKRRSAYVRQLKIPCLPELLIRFGGYRPLRRPLEGLVEEEQLASLSQAWRQEGALTGMINWYRALLKRRFAPLEDYRTDVPVLFASGECDPYLAPSAIKLTADLCSRVDHVRLPGRGHWLAHEDPAAVRRLIGKFLAG